MKIAITMFKKIIYQINSPNYCGDTMPQSGKGLDMGGVVKYEKGKNIDGHHQKSVAQHPEKMTDPRTIEFMEHSNHIKYHQKYGY